MNSTIAEVVLVINPSLWYKPMYPSCLLYLASYLRDHGINCTIVDSAISQKSLPVEKRADKIIETILAINPDIVCFSASHIELNEVIALNNRLKKESPSIRTIVGGSQPTYRSADFSDNGFDFICIGEGEKTLLEFVLEARKTKPDWETIKGLVWKKDSAVIRNPDRELLTEAEMNACSLPAYDLIDKRYFQTNAGIIRGLPLRGAMLLTTRGCPFNCSFCGCNLIFGRQLRFKTLENIEKEVAFLKRTYHIEGLWIIDDTFTINRNHLRGVSEILKKYDIIWGCQSRVNTIDEEMIKVMKEGGCRQIDFGVESGSQRILDEIIGKKITVDQVVKVFELTRKHHIRTLANFMIGLPTETMEEFQKTQELAAQIKADVYIFSIATPLPGTRLYDLVGEKITPEDYNKLNWAGSPLTAKLNKSQISDPVAARRALYKRFYLRSLFRSFISLDNLWFFLSHGSRMQKIACLFRYIKKLFVY